jgi:serine/threonine-protein kinase
MIYLVRIKDINREKRELMTGMVFDNYELKSVIGEGELGVVYLAQSLADGSWGACKILRPEVAADGGAVQRFIFEAKTASKLDHPNVVRAISAGASGGYYYFIMEYVDGCSLERLRLERPEVLSPEFLCARFAELADVLDYAWRTHLLAHGDIKPENIMISTADNRLKLADLGLAGVAVNTDILSDEIMGTPLYLAPELAMGSISKPTVKSDIYSFGVMFYELVCGEAPFSGSVDELLMSHVNGVPDKVLERNPDFPVKLAHFIDRLIAKDPAERPESWREIGAFLRSSPTAAVTDIPEIKQTKKSGVVIAIIITAVIAALISLIFVLL